MRASEILPELTPGKGCIVFDFGYLPNWADGDVVFEFQLGSEVLPLQKLNHRYPNKDYYTITKKKGRGLYKCGYPYFFDLNGTRHWLLVIRAGVKIDDTENVMRLIFPLEIQVTEAKPVCGLSFHLVYDGSVTLTSHEKSEYGWTSRCWTNCKPVREGADDGIILSDPDIIGNTAAYNTVIRPVAQRPEDLMVW